MNIDAQDAQDFFQETATAPDHRLSWLLVQEAFIPLILCIHVN